ncbi:MAG: Thymidylate kinase [candidate division WS2 bacterium]|uniref:Thymidylate kinase n=1 Tax=Psychracetigena formicireducens TaxID=2986056 RepID=A0A9E2BEV5_PSYF1|nr:Thymidylate kinase [Candidatus Psychracetigena formicireducens]MBT9144333.1 Thymidylate kinase [Candidatus Psychracetigena formicireducens]
MNKGIFITIEGLDGAGKSLQANLLAKKLLEIGFPVTLTREPGGTQVAEKIREVILNQRISSKVEALLFLAARISHLEEVIKPAFEKRRIVISSRYIDSSIAYQGFGLGLGGEEILSLNERYTSAFWPQLTLYIKIGLEVSMKRRGKDRIERRPDSYYTRVEEGYNWLIRKFPERIKVIDGERPIEEVHLSIFRVALDYINRMI